MSARLWVAFGVAILLIAGVMSYFASTSPDGLNAATRQGCQVVQTDRGEQLTGNCIARHTTQHPLSASPLAGYTVFGHPATGGLAGIIGALIVLAIAGGAFWLIARTRRTKG
jgi:cobalt/nickel transport protein